MSNKCLVTQFKEAVDIENASYFKKVRMTGSNSANFRIGGIFTITSSTVTSIANWNGTTFNLPFTFDASGGQMRLKPSGTDLLDIFITTEGVTSLQLLGDSKLHGDELSLLQMKDLSSLSVSGESTFNLKMLRDNESIESFAVDSLNVSGDINAFKDTNIRSTNFNVPSTVNGDISSFATINGITTVKISRNNNIAGTIESFGECTSLTSLLLSNNPYLSGDIKTLADLLYTNGKISGTLTVLASGTGCTNSYSGFNNKLRVVIQFTANGYTMTEYT